MDSETLGEENPALLGPFAKIQLAPISVRHRNLGVLGLNDRYGLCSFRLDVGFAEERPVGYAIQNEPLLAFIV